MPNFPSLKCSGCHTCAQLCPVQAIMMAESPEGFKYPQIDRRKCIDCHLCEKKCPVLHAVTLNDCDIAAYACINTDENIRRESSSGGVFSLCAEHIINAGGVVFGARFNESFSVVHGFVRTKEELSAFRGSKYVQSEIGDCYTECKAFLDSGLPVLFTGTPCQIGGLKAYLNKEYENLYLIDIICHGVPSPLLWKKYLNYRTAQANSPVRRIAFRRKDCGWKRYSVAFSYENVTEYRETLDKDLYMQLFLRDVCLRESCYSCSFKTEHRCSDLTIADFWGVDKVCPEMFDDKGTSLVLVQSVKGKKLLETIKSGLKIKEVSMTESIRFNSSYIKSSQRPRSRNTFFRDLETKPMAFVFKKYGQDLIYQRIFLFIKRGVRKILGKKGMTIAKKLLGKI